MADNSAQKQIFDVAGLLDALKRISAQTAPIHAAISQIHQQFRSQATPANVVVSQFQK